MAAEPPYETGESGKKAFAVARGVKFAHTIIETIEYR